MLHCRIYPMYLSHYPFALQPCISDFWTSTATAEVCRVGDAVHAIYQGNGKLYSAYIAHIHGDLITVTWNDGACDGDAFRHVNSKNVYKNGATCEGINKMLWLSRETKSPFFGFCNSVPRLSPFYLLLFFYIVANVCICHNGIPETGAGCPASGASKCASCDLGFKLSQDCTKCIRTCNAPMTPTNTIIVYALRVANVSLVQRMAARALTAWRQWARIVPWMVHPNAIRAMPDGR